MGRGRSPLSGVFGMMDFFSSHSAIIVALTAVGALVVSLFSLWHSYRTSRRQKHADNPFFSFVREQIVKCVTMANKGPSAALNVAVRTKKGTFVKWSRQVNEAQRVCVDDLYNEYEGGEEPWTADCAGTTVNMDPGQSEVLVLAKDVPEDEVLIVTFVNYMGETVTQNQPLRGMSQAQSFNNRVALL